MTVELENGVTAEEELEGVPRGTTVPIHIPEIRLRWLRFQYYVAFTRPLRWLALGIQGSGKSSLLEVIAIRYPKIFDLFGSSDNEGLCWCKREFIELFKAIYGRPPRILLVKGKGIDVASKWDVKTFDQLKLEDFEPYDIITTVMSFYVSEDKYFEGVTHIVNILWKQRLGWIEPWYVLVREAANWVYARLKILKDEGAAKKDFIKSYREARHHGISIAVDTLRWTNIDKEVRDLANVSFLKALGNAGLPRDLWYLYRYFRPYSLMQLTAGVFGVFTNTGAVGFGRFDEPSWHKQEKENILRTTSIEVKRIQDALPTDRRYGVGDFEHSEIIMQYLKKKSMHKAAKELGRSTQTVKRHIDIHNKAVAVKGKCPKCFHANCELAEETIKV